MTRRVRERMSETRFEPATSRYDSVVITTWLPQLSDDVCHISYIEFVFWPGHRACN